MQIHEESQQNKLIILVSGEMNWLAFCLRLLSSACRDPMETVWKWCSKYQAALGNRQYDQLDRGLWYLEGETFTFVTDFAANMLVLSVAFSPSALPLKTVSSSESYLAYTAHLYVHIYITLRLTTLTMAGVPMHCWRKTKKQKTSFFLSLVLIPCISVDISLVVFRYLRFLRHFRKCPQSLLTSYPTACPIYYSDRTPLTAAESGMKHYHK